MPREGAQVFPSAALPVSLIDSTQLVLEAAMRGAMQRQSALTSDLVNADTPGFKPRDVDFQDQLRNAMASGQSPDSVQFGSSVDAQAVSLDGNGVNTDQVSTSLAENGLTYQALTQILSVHESILEYAMGVK